jgi:hypothetical protein
MTLTDAQVQELKGLKCHFPYRIVFGTLKPETGEFVMRTAYTKQTPRNWARRGWKVFLVQ